jgi:hypothetical protein
VSRPFIPNQVSRNDAMGATKGMNLISDVAVVASLRENIA